MEAPDFFEIDEDADKARLLRDTTADDGEVTAVRAAAEACPVLAIQLGDGQP